MGTTPTDPEGPDGAGSTPPTKAAKPGDAYCSNCGYILTGLRDSCKCPECGRAFVDVLTRVPMAKMGRVVRYRSEATFLGWPIIDVALGPDPDRGERQGKARGLIAIGDSAIGAFAWGGAAIGIVSFGGVSVGLVTLGGLSVGVLSSTGGMAVGGFAVGGGAVGAVASGGVAVGGAVQGGMAIGWYSRGGGVVGKHPIRFNNIDPAAQDVFQQLTPLLGPSTGGVYNSLVHPLMVQAMIYGAFSAAIGVIAVLVHLRSRRMRRAAVGASSR